MYQGGLGAGSGGVGGKVDILAPDIAVTSLFDTAAAYFSIII